MTALMITIGLALGLVLGVAYVTALRANVRLYLTGPTARAITLHVARFAGIVVVLGVAALLGAAALLAATLGFTVVRFAATRAEVR
jgi:F1F0 ATPase subunit 2